MEGVLQGGPGHPEQNGRHERMQLTLKKEAGIKQVDDRIWLVTVMHYDPGFFDDETCRLGSVECWSSGPLPVKRGSPLRHRAREVVAEREHAGLPVFVFAGLRLAF